MPSWTQEPITGHWTLRAPHRADRPRATPGVCPFCKGNESMTPPTVEDLPPGGGWTARAFPNSHPILPTHEVIVNSPRHVERFDALTQEEAARAVRLWAHRMRAARKGGHSPLLYENDGAGAGASIPHAHAQLVSEFEVLPRLKHEAETFARGCPFEQPRYATDHLAPNGWRVVTPVASRFADEVWILPKRHEPRFETGPDEGLDAFGALLLAETRRLAGRGVRAYNIVLHTAPAQRDFHWHAEILPRTDGIGGFELGSGVFVNPGA